MICLFIRGLLDSLYCVITLVKIECIDSYMRILYNKIFLYNVIIYLPFTLFLDYICTISDIYILYAIVLLLWKIPNYCFTVLYTDFYTTKLVESYIQLKPLLVYTNTKHIYNTNINTTTINAINAINNNIIPKVTTINKPPRKIDYTKHAIYTIYKQAILVFLLFESIFISLITLLPVVPPFIRTFLDWFFTSIMYSYYTCDYYWENKKLKHTQKYVVFESYWSYYLGYGCIIGLIKISFSYFIGYFIIESLLPIYTINAFLQDNIINHSNNVANNVVNSTIKFPVFYIPVVLANKIVNKISSKLRKK